MSDPDEEPMQTQASPGREAAGRLGPSTLTIDRYQPLRELGRGGSGLILEAKDARTGRRVAIKGLLAGAAASAEEVERFIREAELTAQLEHPAIIPIYDLGFDPAGLPYYSMRVVDQRSLREVLQRRGDDWPLTRLCGVLVQVLRALAWAHAHGVVHRDLKPENVLLGSFGEVYVTDWGIAKKLTGKPESATTANAAKVGETLFGQLLGTPGYMSPEQARGDWPNVDQRSDLFAIGVMLFELLAGRRPFEGDSLESVLFATTTFNPPSPRQLNPGAPLSLDELCMALLQKSPEDRPPSAKDVADQLEQFLEGSREREKKRAAAKECVAAATVPLQRYREMATQLEAARTKARLIGREIATWAELEAKRPLWAAERHTTELELALARTQAEAAQLLTQAIGYDPTLPEARLALADLHWLQATEAAAAHREPDRLYHEALVAVYDDGRYARMLSAPATVSIESEQVGAVAIAHPLVEVDHRLTSGPAQPLGETPVRNAQLAPGRWRIVLNAPGRAELTYPVFLERGEAHAASIKLRAPDELGPDFVLVPAGPCLFGGDPEAYDALPTERAHVPDFAIARYPVTWGEYLRFLDQLEEPELSERIPRTGRGGDALAVRKDGRWVLRDELLVTRAGRAYCPDEALLRLPVCGVTWFDALAYARFRAATDLPGCRLPTDRELEKAARGADGRFFPWGDRHDPGFSKMRDSRQGLPSPEPVGAFPTDESVYGVRDLVGGIRAWAADIDGELSAEAAAAEQANATALRVVRGGSWDFALRLCRAAGRRRDFAIERRGSIGIRLARTLP